MSAMAGEKSSPPIAPPAARRIGPRIGSVISKIHRESPAGSGSWTHDRITRANIPIVSASERPSTNVRRNAIRKRASTLLAVHAPRGLVEPITRRRRSALILITAFEARRAIRLRGRGRHRAEGDLPDAHPLVQRDRQV